MTDNYTEKLKDIRNQLDRLELEIRVCDKHAEYMHEIISMTSDTKFSTDYEKEICKDAYKRMALQDKIRKLMKESFDLQEKILAREE